jgi:hypothetical protein
MSYFEEWPQLMPTLPADDHMIESDLEVHGCAYVVRIGDKEWMIHPNYLTVYGEPKHTKTLLDD